MSSVLARESPSELNNFIASPSLAKSFAFDDISVMLDSPAASEQRAKSVTIRSPSQTEASPPRSILRTSTRLSSNLAMEGHQQQQREEASIQPEDLFRTPSRRSRDTSREGSSSLIPTFGGAVTPYITALRTQGLLSDTPSASRVGEKDEEASQTLVEADQQKKNFITPARPQMNKAEEALQRARSVVCETPLVSALDRHRAEQFEKREGSMKRAAKARAKSTRFAMPKNTRTALRYRAVSINGEDLSPSESDDDIPLTHLAQQPRNPEPSVSLLRRTCSRSPSMAPVIVKRTTRPTKSAAASTRRPSTTAAARRRRPAAAPRRGAASPSIALVNAAATAVSHKRARADSTNNAPMRQRRQQRAPSFEQGIDFDAYVSEVTGGGSAEGFADELSASHPPRSTRRNMSTASRVVSTAAGRRTGRSVSHLHGGSMDPTSQAISAIPSDDPIYGLFQMAFPPSTRVGTERLRGPSRMGLALPTEIGRRKPHLL